MDSEELFVSTEKIIAWSMNEKKYLVGTFEHNLFCYRNAVSTIALALKFKLKELNLKGRRISLSIRSTINFKELERVTLDKGTGPKGQFQKKKKYKSIIKNLLKTIMKKYKAL